MSKWVGYAVSVNCGEPLGCYQGTILEADGTTITLTKAFRNGFPYPKSKVTLNAADIKSLQIIECRSEPPEQTHSTVAVSKSSKKVPRSTVCENLQANPTTSAPGQTTSTSKASSGRSAGSGVVRSKPIDIQGTRTNRSGTHAGSYGNIGCGGGGPGGSAQKGPPLPQERARRRNEACFGDEAEPALDNDFDFESNLALFDKRAEWERLRSARPDLVRHADDKYRHDQNVLGAPDACGASALGPGLRVPDALRGPLDYVTDEGALVPSATGALRAALWAGIDRLGLGEGAALLLARAAADVCLRLVGGGRRLEARNAHQSPTVVALAGPHRAGAAGLAAARLLASHGARVAYHLPSAAAAAARRCADMSREMRALALSDISATETLERLPSPDLVVVALYDPQLDDEQDAYRAALAWSGAARAAVVAVEPPGVGSSAVAGAGAWSGVSARASVCALWAPALPPALGRLYLADAAPPLRLYADLQLGYRPPFGANSVLALHPHPALP